jgi:hypothetical protein
VVDMAWVTVRRAEDGKKERAGLGRRTATASH